MLITDSTTSGLEAMRGRLDGELVTASDPAWDAARQAFNLNVDQRPAAIVLAESAADVASAVRFARDAGLRVAPQSTGHNAGPLESGLEGALLVKTTRMKGVEIDAGARRARVNAGARWGDVVPQASELGLSALHGSSPTVGVTGYSLGGGMGWQARKRGLQTNSLTAAELVTADGELRRVDADHDPDLFWALRGGGGNFGVVTALEFALYPGDDMYAGIMFWPWEQSADVLHAWNELLPSLPEEITSSMRLLQFPPLDEIPELLRGKSFAAMDAVFLGSEADGAELFRPLRELGPVMDTFAMVPPAALSTLHMDPEDPMPTHSASRLLHALPSAGMDALLELTGPGSGSSLGMVELRHAGGALGRVKPGSGALGKLEGELVLFAGGLVVDADTASQTHAQLSRLTESLDAWDAGRYLNFVEGPEDTSLAYGDAAYARLGSVKDAYDPDGLFRANHPVG